MKICKNILFIATLFIVGSMDAKNIIQPTSQPAPMKPTLTPAPKVVVPASAIAPGIAPAPAGISYKSLLTEIRAEKIPGQIIADDGVFTDPFLDRIKSSGLAPLFVEALLQAGRNLHLYLTGDNDQDQETVAYAGERIDGFMSQYSLPSIAPIRIEPLEEDLQVTDIPELFYDDKTDLLQQDFLNMRVNKLLESKSYLQSINILQSEFNPLMRREWANKNVSGIVSKSKALNKQIVDTVRTMFKKLPAVPQKRKKPELLPAPMKKEDIAQMKQLRKEATKYAESLLVIYITQLDEIVATQKLSPSSKDALEIPRMVHYKFNQLSPEDIQLIVTNAIDKRYKSKIKTGFQYMALKQVFSPQNWLASKK